MGSLSFFVFFFVVVVVDWFGLFPVCTVGGEVLCCVVGQVGCLCDLLVILRVVNKQWLLGVGNRSANGGERMLCQRGRDIAGVGAGAGKVH